MTERRNAQSSATLTDEDVFELLPWYATGKTTPEETKAIDQRLAGSPRLQAELAMVRREQQVSKVGETFGDAPPELLNRILGQLDGARQLPPIARDDPEQARGAAGGWLARLFGFIPTPALRLALAIACLVVVVESAVLLRQNGSSGTYETASAPDTTAAGPQLIVTFQPNAGLAAAGSTISELGANIVKGPRPDGAYVIALPQGADVDAAIAKLRGHSDLIASVDRGS